MSFIDFKNNKYLNFEKYELNYILISSLILAIMFSITFSSLINSSFSFQKFILILIFIFFMQITRFYFMKIYAYTQGIKLNLKAIYFDRFFFRKWDKVSYYLKDLFPKGFIGYIISIIIYILTFGIIIFPETYNFKYSKIEHLYVGTRFKFESSPRFQSISEYRQSKILFVGILFYFLFGFILKLFSNILGFNFYNIMILILYYFAIFSTIPIPLTQGYDLYLKNKTAWIASISILILSLFSLLIFKNPILIIISVILSIIIIIIIILWKLLMH